ncbi:hypothetical protein D3C71_1663740 [compost metagenome]
MEHAATLRARDGNVVVFVVNDGELGQQRIAVIAVVIHGVAAIGVLRPDRVGQKLVVRHLRKVRQAACVPMVRALHLLQKNQVCGNIAHGFAQLVQHEAPVKGGEALVHVHGQNLERDGLRGVVGHGNNRGELAPPEPPTR